MLRRRRQIPAGQGLFLSELALEGAFVGETKLVSNQWIGDTLGSVVKALTGDPLVRAPGDWSGGNGGNKTGQSRSSGCGDQLDGLIKEYSNETYPANYTPTCAEFTASTNAKPSENFTFQELNRSDIQPKPPSPDFPDWAIFQSSLLGGLESIRASIGGEPVNIESAYRSPKVQNAIDQANIAAGKYKKPSPQSRHLHGDGVDIRTGNNPSVWQMLHDHASSPW